VQQYRYFEELSEFKHEFLSNISNELRSPMNSIMGFNDILLHSNPHPQQLDSILSVKNASLKLMQVIQDIIDFTAVKTGELHIKNNHFKLREILDRVQSVSQAHALHKDLQFTFDYPHDLPEFVLGDNVRFSQILLNLIGNALNITEKGQVLVAVDQIDSGRQEFCSLLINIYYEGSILPKNQSRLSFLETSETLKEQADFGFSSTKGLIEMLGGSLSFESKDPQKGNFDIRLSFKIGEKPREDEELMINTLTGIKILLVEDSLLNQKLAQKMLQKLNADITLANNGQVALNYLQKERFDLILLDLQMPVMDGFTTIRNIRQNLELDTPVIAVTGLSQHDEKERCLSAGMNDYLSKPFKKEDLFRKLHKFLANK
jgi:CheY-like chemotaxis protein